MMLPHSNSTVEQIQEMRCISTKKIPSIHWFGDKSLPIVKFNGSVKSHASNMGNK